MTTIIDLGSHQVRFGSARQAEPWIIPQHLISYSLVNAQDAYSFNDFGISINADSAPALIGGYMANMDQVERTMSLVSVCAASGQPVEVASYLADLKEQSINADQIQTKLPQVPNIPRSLLARAEEFDTSAMQKIFIATPHTAAQKYQLCQILFEKYNVSKIGFGEQSVMSLFSTGNVSGMSVNLGHGQTTVSAVMNGYWISSQTLQTNMLICGEQVRRTMTKILQQQQLYFNEDYESQYLTNCMKNHISFAQADSRKDIKFQMPDGQSFSVPQGVFQWLGDIYENPEFLGIHEPSVHKMLQIVTKNIPESNQSHIRTLHMSGGMANMGDLVNSIARKYENNLGVRMTCSRQPQYDCFVGCQAVVQTAADNWFIDKRAFNEQGEKLFDTKKSEDNM